MAGRRDCDSAIVAGRMSKAIEFFDAADLLGKEMANAAGDLYIAAAEVICCVRLVCTRTPATTTRPSRC